MNMKVNKLLWVGLGTAILVIVLLGLSMCSGPAKRPPMISKNQTGQATTAEADTPAEAIANLTNKMTTFERSVTDSEKRDKEISKALKGLEDRMSTGIGLNSRSRASTPLSPAADQLNAKNAEIEELKRQLEEAKRASLSQPGRPTPVPLGTENGGVPEHIGSDIPEGLGYESKKGLDVPFLGNVSGLLRNTTIGLPGNKSTPSLDSLIWVQALNAHAGSPLSMAAASHSVQNAASSIADQGPELDVTNGDAASIAAAQRKSRGSRKSVEEMPRAVYTIPANATLMGAVTMTALIGRVPNQGAVQDPYPFKVITGPDNLATNGIHIPGLQGMVWQGTAVGDWGLSCVRGTLDTVTFTFSDGTIQTVDLNTARRDGGRNPTSSSTQARALAWVSDARGICVPGERISNAAPVLTARILSSGLEAAAKAYAQAETTTYLNTTTGAGYQALTGDPLKFSGYSAAAGGASDLRKWLDDRLGQIFDAVYAPPATELAVHVNVEIPIDFDPIGRKVNHENLAANRNPALD